MNRAFRCPVCGEDECRRHHAVLMAASFVNVCAWTGLSLLAGLIAIRYRTLDEGKAHDISF
jgi:hypothetical protein